MGANLKKGNLEEYSLKRGIVAIIKMAIFPSAVVFWGQDGYPLDRCSENKITAFGGK